MRVPQKLCGGTHLDPIQHPLSGKRARVLGSGSCNPGGTSEDSSPTDIQMQLHERPEARAEPSPDSDPQTTREVKFWDDFVILTSYCTSFGRQFFIQD